MSDTADLRIDPSETYDWTAAADELLDEAVDRNERIACQFEEFSLGIPVRTGSDPPLANWEFDGGVEIAIKGERGPLVDWMEWWNDKV